MKLDKAVNTADIVQKMEEFSGAEIKSAATEAGYFAIRENRTNISKEDFHKAIEKIKASEEYEDNKEHSYMFG